MERQFDLDTNKKNALNEYLVTNGINQEHLKSLGANPNWYIIITRAFELGYEKATADVSDFVRDGAKEGFSVVY